MRFDEFEIGQKFTSQKKAIKKDEIYSFAEKYDSQRIHLDEEYAMNGPFGNIIASGYQTLGLAWNLFANMNILGPDSRGGIGLDEVRWKKPVYPEEQIYSEVKVDYMKKTSRGDRGVIKFLFHVKNQDDELVLEFTSITLIAV